MLLVSNEKLEVGKAMLALKPKGSQSMEGSSNCVMDMPCC